MRTNELERRLERILSPNGASAGADRDAPPLPVLRVAPIRSRPVPPVAPAPESAEAPASDNSTFFRTILDQIPDPVCVKDATRTLVMVNSAFCALVGRSEAELIGRPFNLPPHTDEASDLDERVLRSGQPLNVETPVLWNSEQRVWRVERRVLEGPDAFLVVTVQDVTRRADAEIALRETDAKHRSERATWEQRLRRLRRGLLIQFSAVGVAIGLAAGGYLAGRASDVAAEIAPTDAPVVATVEATPPPMAEPPTPKPASPTPPSTETPAPLASPTASFTPLPPQATVAPTVTPDAFVLDGSAVVAAPPPAPLREFGPSVFNIVLMGSDRRPGDGGWRTDVLILVSVDPEVPSVTMLSFPRDMWVYIPGWRWQRINLADERGEESDFPGGGPALVKQVIQYNFGIPVQYYARVDFGGYKRLIDNVGGVDVVADCPLYDIFPDVPGGQTDILTGDALAAVLTGTIDIPAAGVYHLDGKHALWYSRSRKTTSDFDRSRRQQRVLRALWAELREQGLLAQVPQLWDALTQSVETDLALNDVVFLADVGARLDSSHVRSRFIDGSMLTWHVTETGASVLRYSFDELKPYLDETFAPQPKNVAAQAPVRVDVLNASGRANWERVAADALGWSGFTVFGADVYDSVLPHTILIEYATSAKASRAEALAELFQIKPENIHRKPDPTSAADYDLVIGQDFEPCRPPSRGRWPAPPPTPTATPLP